VYLHKLFGISLHRAFVSSSLFIYLYSIIYLCQYELPDVSTVYFLKDHFSPMGKTGKAAKHFHEQSGLGLVSSSSQECVKSSV
jgi:hypothetical protein